MVTPPPLAVTPLGPVLSRIYASTSFLTVLVEVEPATATPTPAPPPAPTARAPPIVRPVIVAVSVAESDTAPEAVTFAVSMNASTVSSMSLLE